MISCPVFSLTKDLHQWLKQELHYKYVKTKQRTSSRMTDSEHSIGEGSKEGYRGFGSLPQHVKKAFGDCGGERG